MYRLAFLITILLVSCKSGETKLNEVFAIIEKSGEKVHLTEGEDTNIKITFPTDLLIAEQILSKRNT